MEAAADDTVPKFEFLSYRFDFLHLQGLVAGCKCDPSESASMWVLSEPKPSRRSLFRGVAHFASCPRRILLECVFVLEGVWIRLRVPSPLGLSGERNTLKIGTGYGLQAGAIDGKCKRAISD
jgi:hypothetical protein